VFKLPRSVDYGVLILVTLYEAEDPNYLSASSLAERCNLSPQHVAKILKALQRQDIVGSIRGPKGGYYLQPKARHLNLTDVYRCLEGPLFMSECLREGECDCRALPNCRLKPYMERLNLQIRDAMARITLAELSQPNGYRTQVTV